MSHMSYCLVGIVLAAQPALADVTPRQVWDGWLAVAAERGAEIETGAVEDAGDRLVVRNLAMVSGAEERGRYAIAVDEIVLAQNPDGTVAVTSSPSYPVTLTEQSAGGPLQETRLRVEHPGLEMTVADAAGTRVHSFAAPTLRVIVEETRIDGEVLDLEGGATLTDVSGRYDAGGGDAGASAFAAAGAGLKLDGTDPDTGERFSVEVGLDGFESENLLQLIGPDPAAMARALPEGTAREGSFRNGGTTFRFGSEAEASTLTGSMGPAETTIALSRDGIRYESRSEGGNFAVSGSAIPMPEVSLGVGEVAASLQAPLLAAEGPQPYAFTLSLLELALDEGLWNMVDPAGVLPRTPGDLTLDVAGNVIVAEDVNPAGVTASPGDVQNVAINTVRIAIADAVVEAAGQLELPGPDDMQPVGEIAVTLTGVAALLEKLVQVGLIPQDQAMMAQMMLGMFARPGATEGELVSNIRLAEDGSIFVNDQQVR